MSKLNEQLDRYFALAIVNHLTHRPLTKRKEWMHKIHTQLISNFPKWPGLQRVQSSKSSTLISASVHLSLSLSPFLFSLPLQ